ncbi:MAG: alpha/beta hydrolase [Arachnia propionica]|uniref:alpha/beta fold hydrolase n=1 Tax=Arachnia propionica TaxID=1750 RepID=UPI0026F53324|nr:alpha/beta hydrolase [Arachnia propionica]
MRPLVVLVHGSLSNAAEWSGYTELLPGCDVVAVDLPGHGGRVDEVFTTRGAIRAIERAVAQRGGGQPVVLVGHSLGGYMASLHAARNPGVLAGLVLIGATGDPHSPLAAVYRGYAWLVDHVNHERLARVRDAVARRLGVPAEHVPDAASYAVLPAAWQAVIDDCPPRLMSRVDCPVLIVNGQFDQMRISERRYRELAPEARVVTVPRATHLAPLTHPDQVAHLIQDFVRTL